MIKNCDSIQDYNDSCAEYFKYHNNRFTCSETEKRSNNCITGISFKITTPEQFADEEIRKIFGSDVCILDDTLPLLGRYCRTTQGSLDEGTFIGIEATEEDFYYMLKKADNTIIYESCVGGIEDRFPEIEY